MFTMQSSLCWIKTHQLPAMAIVLLSCGLSISAEPARQDATDQSAGTLETIPADEEAIIQQIVAKQLGAMNATKETAKIRGQHGKHHGCVQADFIIRDDIPEEHQVGLFAQQGSFKSSIRFSNGRFSDDTKGDGHGMAIKVRDVKGSRAVDDDGLSEQDFVLMDNPVFFADAKTVLAFMEAGEKKASGDANAMAAFARDFPDAMKMVPSMLKKDLPSPLAVQYWSTVPYRLGKIAVKYTAIPSVENAPESPTAFSENYLRETMVEFLTNKKTTAKFDLAIIPQGNPAVDLVENSQVEWKATPIRVATIVIGPQSFTSEEQLAACEKASFDPWHALADHAPIGGINRARKELYKASLKRRVEAQE